CCAEFGRAGERVPGVAAGAAAEGARAVRRVVRRAQAACRGIPGGNPWQRRLPRDPNVGGLDGGGLSASGWGPEGPGESVAIGFFARRTGAPSDRRDDGIRHHPLAAVEAVEGKWDRLAMTSRWWAAGPPGSPRRSRSCGTVSM